MLSREIEGEIVNSTVVSVPGSYTSFYQGIYESIVQEKALPVTAEEGWNTIRLIEAAFESSAR